MWQLVNVIWRAAFKDLVIVDNLLSKGSKIRFFSLDWQNELHFTCYCVLWPKNDHVITSITWLSKIGLGEVFNTI